MNIQTLSIVVPTKGCVNHCPFCVSRMHDKEYGQSFDKFQMSKRLKWAIMNGINTVILTGTGEALQNTKFLNDLADLFEEMGHPFPNIELQTTGVMLYRDASVTLLRRLGVNTISLSIANIFSDKLNTDTIQVSKSLEFELQHLILFLKGYHFNVRLSLNMLKDYDDYGTHQIFDRCKELKADQITFRKMWYDKDESPLTPESQWIKDNACEFLTLSNVKKYVVGTTRHVNMGRSPLNFVEHGAGKFLYTLPFGGKVYSVDGMSVVIDDDCMSKENNTSLKYAILRENGKLYAQWDDEGSLIF